MGCLVNSYHAREARPAITRPIDTYPMAARVPTAALCWVLVGEATELTGGRLLIVVVGPEKLLVVVVDRELVELTAANEVLLPEAVTVILIEVTPVPLQRVLKAATERWLSA